MSALGLDALLDYLRGSTRPWDAYERRVAVEEILPIAYAVGAESSAMPPAVGALRTLLDSHSRHTRSRSARALAEVLKGTGTDGLEALAALDLDADPRWRDALPLWTIACLAGTDWASTEARVLGMLAHPSPARRKHAWTGVAVAFGDGGEERAAEAIMSSLRPADDVTTRFAAVAAAATVLRRHVRVEHLEWLMAAVSARELQAELATGRNPLLPVAEAARASEAARAFMKRHLVPLIGCPGRGRAPAWRRAAAIAAICAAAPDGAAQSLWRHLSDPVRAVRWATLWSIPRMSVRGDPAAEHLPTAPPPDTGALAGWWEACRLLCLGATRSVEPEAERALMRATRSRSALVASAALLGLGVAFEGVPECAAIEHLGRALESSANSTWAAALALGMVRARSGCEETTRTLAGLARRARNPRTAPACAAALGLVAESHGSGAARDVLTELLRHSGGAVAPLAARGLVAAFLGAGAWTALDAGWRPGPWHYVLGAPRKGIAAKCGSTLDGRPANR